jgi:hypothetical protein
VVPKTEPCYRIPAASLAKYPDLGIDRLRSLLSSRSQVSHTTELFHPNISCYHDITGGYCRNPDCKKHGYHERNRRAALWAQFDPSQYDVYSLTLPFACYVIESQYLSVREAFRASIRNALKDIGYKDFCFRTEFVDMVPHIHWLFRLPVGSDFVKVSGIVRQCWKDALCLIGAWNSQRVGIDSKLSKTRYDLFKLSDYCYSTNYSSWRLNNCRPRE